MWAEGQPSEHCVLNNSALRLGHQNSVPKSEPNVAGWTSKSTSSGHFASLYPNQRSEISHLNFLIGRFCFNGQRLNWLVLFLWKSIKHQMDTKAFLSMSSEANNNDQNCTRRLIIQISYVLFIGNDWNYLGRPVVAEMTSHVWVTCQPVTTMLHKQSSWEKTFQTICIALLQRVLTQELHNDFLVSEHKAIKIFTMHSGTISIRPMQSSEYFQTCNFPLILTIMSEIIITCLSWGGFPLLKLKKITSRQRKAALT